MPEMAQEFSREPEASSFGPRAGDGAYDNNQGREAILAFAIASFKARGSIFKSHLHGRGRQVGAHPPPVHRAARRRPARRAHGLCTGPARSAAGRADQGQWNLEAKEAQHGREVKLKLSVLEDGDQAHEVATVGFPYFGGIDTPNFSANKQASAVDDVLVRHVPVRRIKLGKAGEERYALVATVFDLTAANYGVARGLPGENAATSYDHDTPDRKSVV